MISVKVTANGFKEAMANIDRLLDPSVIEEKAKELCERLAYIGVKEASIRFTQGIPTNGTVNCHAEPIDNGWRIVAEGKDVCFIEFGAGVHYNGNEPYPLPRPAGIKGIGEYRVDGGPPPSKGIYDGWWYRDETGKPTYTHGTPASMPMYHATKEILDSISQIANEVFTND